MTGVEVRSVKGRAGGQGPSGAGGQGLRSQRVRAREVRVRGSGAREGQGGRSARLSELSKILGAKA